MKKLLVKPLLWLMTIIDVTLWHIVFYHSKGPVTFRESYNDNRKFLQDLGWDI